MKSGDCAEGGRWRRGPARGGGVPDEDPLENVVELVGLVDEVCRIEHDLDGVGTRGEVHQGVEPGPRGDDLSETVGDAVASPALGDDAVEQNVDEERSEETVADIVSQRPREIRGLVCHQGRVDEHLRVVGYQHGVLPAGRCDKLEVCSLDQSWGWRDGGNRGRCRPRGGGWGWRSGGGWERRWRRCRRAGWRRKGGRGRGRLGLRRHGCARRRSGAVGLGIEEGAGGTVGGVEVGRGVGLEVAGDVGGGVSVAMAVGGATTGTVGAGGVGVTTGVSVGERAPSHALRIKRAAGAIASTIRRWAVRDIRPPGARCKSPVVDYCNGFTSPAVRSQLVCYNRRQFL